MSVAASLREKKSAPRRVALIGLGGIAQTVLEKFDAVGEGLACVGVLVRPGRLGAAEAFLRGSYPAVENLEDLLRLDPDVVVECAGQQALLEHGEAVLAADRDLVTVSVGAFADAAFEARMRRLAAVQEGRVMIPSGAIAGMDGLTAALGADMTEVTYRGRKPAKSWAGTPAESLLDLGALSTATTFYEGSAREAARDYPKNANVTATIALAGIGFDKTRVALIADPEATANVHELEFSGAFGRVSLVITGKPSPSNPKTSVLTALSVWQNLINRGNTPVTLG